jgi:hypothetical protein
MIYCDPHANNGIGWWGVERFYEEKLGSFSLKALVGEARLVA